MSSFTLTLSGTSSDLSANYFPPIELNDNYSYACGLIDFQSFMSIPNVTNENNRLYFSQTYDIELPAGIYLLSHIKDRLINQLKPDIIRPNIHEFNYEFKDLISQNDSIEIYSSNYDLIRLFKLIDSDFDRLSSFEAKLQFLHDKMFDKVKEHQLNNEIEFVYVTSDVTLPYRHKDYIQLQIGSYEIADIERQVNDLCNINLQISVDKNTLKCTLKSSHMIYFNEKHTLASILGFKGDRILLPGIAHKSDYIIKISGVNVIKIECNIIEGAYSNDDPMHTLHEFYPTVGIGYKIVEVPQNVIYLPLTVRTIHNINIRIVDQSNNLVDFRGELVTLRVHIKKST